MKSNRDTARLHLVKALQDRTAADVLSRNPDVAVESIGFHLQQAYEKGLKALLAFKGVSFRKTHDIGFLIDLLVEQGIALPDGFNDIDELTPFGVELRYDDIPVGLPNIDREKSIKELFTFLDWVCTYTGIPADSLR